MRWLFTEYLHLLYISEEMKPTGLGGWAAHEQPHERDLNSSSDFLFLSLNSTSKVCLCSSSSPHSLLWLCSSEHDKRRASCSGCVCEGSSFDLPRASLTDWQMVPFKLICSIWMVSCWHLPEMTTVWKDLLIRVQKETGHKQYASEATRGKDGTGVKPDTGDIIIIWGNI